MKVCIIYGSESGNSERAVKAIAKRWQGSNFEIGEIMEGATAAVRGFAALAEQYDFLVVATCVEIKTYGAFVLNHRVVLHAIDATPAR